MGLGEERVPVHLPYTHQHLSAISQGSTLYTYFTATQQLRETYPDQTKRLIHTHTHTHHLLRNDHDSSRRFFPKTVVLGFSWTRHTHTHISTRAKEMSAIPPKPATSKEAPSAVGGAGLRYPTNGKTIYSRTLNRTRTSELSQSSFAYLFSEMVSYAQKRVTGIQDLEKRFASFVVFHPTTHASLPPSLFSLLFLPFLSPSHTTAL